MSIELTMLVWTLILAFVQVLLFSSARTAQYGRKWNTGPRDAAMPPLNPVAGRLQRAQTNLFETLPLFMGGVLVAHLIDRENKLTAIGAQLYFWGRVAYLPLYALGIPFIRTLVWLASAAGLVLIYYVLLMPQ
ncbi:MAG TPA: MAPEG family protein [Rhizomicrobium sp.]|nr:MAPEG family protein [Rhizomicrobium sp.]